MTPLQVEFFNASLDAENDRKQAAEKAEKDRKQQRQRLVGVLSTGIVLTTSSTLFAVVQLQQVQRQRAEQLALTTAEAQFSSQPVEAQVSAIAAFGLNQSAFVKFPNHPLSASVQGSLLDVIRVNKEQNQLQHIDMVFSVAFSPDGKRLVSGNYYSN